MEHTPWFYKSAHDQLMRSRAHIVPQHKLLQTCHGGTVWDHVCYGTGMDVTWRMEYAFHDGCVHVCTN